MQGMDRNKNHVSPAVDEFDNLFYPSVIVFHLDQAAEHTHTVVYVHHIISQIEGVEVVQGKLLGFFHRTAKPDAVETVENLVVRIPANLVLVVYESGMDVLFFYKFRQGGVFVLQHNGPEAFQLALLFSEYIYLIIILYARADIRYKEFEVLVENRLGRNMEGDAFLVLSFERNIQIYPLERRQLVKERLFLIHIGRIQPDGGIPGKEADQRFPFFPLRFPGGDIRIDIGLFQFFDGKLGIAVEGVDLVHLVSEEGNAVGLIQGIGENIDDGTSYCILSGGRYKVCLLEAFFLKTGTETFVGKVFTDADGEKGAFQFFLGRYFFFQGFRIGDYEDSFIGPLENLSDSCRALNPQRRLVIAPFHALSRFGEKKHAVSLREVVKICAAVFGRFPGGKNNQVKIIRSYLGENRPAGRQEKPTAKYFRTILKLFLQQGRGFLTYQHSLYFPVEKLFITLLITQFSEWKEKDATAIHSFPTGFAAFFNNSIYS